jgi:hypothetical protein
MLKSEPHDVSKSAEVKDLLISCKNVDRAHIYITETTISLVQVEIVIIYHGTLENASKNPGKNL